MEILKDRCVGCGNCIAWCPMGCIYIGEDGLAEVNLDECVECNNCFRMCPDEGRSPTLVKFARRVLKTLHLTYVPPPDVCPTGALHPPDLEWPRVVRSYFSDPTTSHEYATGVRGRGTEEVKTNDVTGRLGYGDVGFQIDVGRPGIGARFKDVEKISMALAMLGVDFEPKNPVTFLMSDAKTGKIRDDILNEKVLSCIIEFKTDVEKIPEILEKLRNVSTLVETVISVAVAARCNPDGSIPYQDIVRKAGWTLSDAGKTNLGLGRPLAQ